MEPPKDIFDIIMQVASQFAGALPNLIGALLVAVFGWLAAKIVAKALEKIFQKIKIDRLAERLNKTDFVSKANIKIVPSKLFAKIIHYILVLIFLMAATEVLQMSVVSAMMADLISYIPKLLSALILFVIGILLADFIKNITLTTCNSLGIPSANVIANFVFYLIFLTLTISALKQASIATELISANLTIILGGVILAFSIGYGFASRDLMSNFLASFYTKKKIKPGDIISIDGAKGKIISMDSNSLTLQAKDKQIVIPLKKLTSEKVEIFNR